MSYQPRPNRDPFQFYSEFDITPDWSTDFEGEWQGEVPDKTGDRYTLWAQQSLNKALKWKIDEDGQFGNDTRGALRTFRKREGLKQTVDALCPDDEKKLIGAGAGPPPGPLVARPQETTPPGLTIYEDIPLQVPLGKAKSMTGIFIPDKYCPGPEVDVIVYLHGFKRRSYKPWHAIDDYWKLPLFPLREKVNDSQKNVIFVAPTLGPTNQPGSLVCAGGFDKFLDQVMSALKRTPFFSGKPTPSVRHLVLACHSGSGWVMKAIIQGSDSSVKKIKECWLFEPDNLGDSKGWKNWVQSPVGGKLFIHFAASPGKQLCQDLLGPRKRVGSGKTTCMTNVDAEQTTGHDDVPMKHLSERIKAATFLTAKSSCAVKSKSSEFDFEWRDSEGAFESEVYETIPLWIDREFETAKAVPSPKTISLFNTDLNAPYFGGNFNFRYNGGSNEAWVTYNTYFSYTKSFPDEKKTILRENLKKAVAIWDNCAELQVKDIAGNYNDRIRLRFKLNIVKDPKNANKRTQVHPDGSRSVFFIDKDRETVMRDLNIFIGSSRNVLVHELGHVWGLKDEYKDRWISMKLSLGHVGPGSPLIKDTTSIMNTGYETDAGEFRTRYFQHFGRAILGAFWGLKKYMIPARMNGRVVSNSVIGRIALRKRDIGGNAPYTADRAEFNTLYTHIQIAKRA